MEAIILAGGFGKRLRPIISDMPKPMAPIRGKPFLEYLLIYLSHAKFNHVIISLGYKGEAISNKFGNNFLGMNISYVQEKVPLGTGGGARLGLTKSKEDYIYIFNGDTFIDIDFEEIESSIYRENKPIIISANVVDTSRYGRLITQNKLVIDMSEKGQKGPGKINAGCYILPKVILKDWELNINFSLEIDFIKPLLKTNNVLYIDTKGIFIDIGIPEDYNRARELAFFNEK